MRVVAASDALHAALAGHFNRVPEREIPLA
jgi:hypothetical protein